MSRSHHVSGRPIAAVSIAFAALIFTLLAAPRGWSQTTIATGSIIGTIADQSGAIVPNASVTISNKATGRVLQRVSNTTGTYNSGGLLPGNYVVRVEAKGFKTAVLPVTVQVGVTSAGNVALQVGSTETVVQVQASSVAVNTVQPTIQSVLTAQQIQQLPINGRNFLDLAQLQPGVQIQDGADFDPTKNGYSSVSFSGRFGRAARIEIDGVDISDETVGTTTMNIPASAIQEFQVESSSLDLSTELTSSGAINVTTKSGQNQFHGGGYYYGRWNQLAARIAPTNLFFRREQFGADVGGPIKKDKLFFFMDWERTRQDLASPVLLGAPFSSLSSSVNQPFKEHDLDGRLDWQINSNFHAFYRYTYNINSDVVPFIPNTFSPFLNRNHAQDHVVGLDFNTGVMTHHQIRFGYLRFANQITDAVSGSGIFDPAPGIELGIGGDPFCLTAGLDNFCSGVNFLAPQATQQHDTQIKYDGSTISGSNVFRYGFSWNHILGGGFASFLASAPAVGNNFTAADIALAAKGPFPGGSSNPQNYTVDSVTMGNGIGYSTAIPQFGFPAGGQFDNRVQAYVGDTWKARRNFVVDWGLRYVRDTGRDDNQLGTQPILAQFAPGLDRAPHQPDLNFAPQLGIAWDPWSNGKTVIRAGAGLYYENDIFNNILFDAPARLQKGLFLGFAPLACPAGTATFPGGQSVTAPGICGQPIGVAAPLIATLQKQFQAATIAAGPAANGVYIGNTLADNASTGTNLISPDFRTPFSWQFNGGFERQLYPGTVLSVDYVRNVALHYLLFYDTNHVGDARYFNAAAAMNAVNATNQGFGCPAGPAGVNCAITAGATINSYAANGLDSGAAVNGGFPGCNCAFPGVNPNVGQNEMLFPIGRSVYNALDVSLRQNVSNPFRGLRSLSLQASYALSRYVAMANDSDFINGATDFANINKYIGPTGLDRTDQFSIGAVGTLPGGFRLSFITHAYTALPVTLTVPPGPQRTPTTAQIFLSDLTGDGTTGDVLPGTNIGSFGRQVNAGNINQYITNYNNNVAGKPTPAGMDLVNAGLFTVAQLQALGGVPQKIGMAPNGQVNMGGLYTSDLGLTYVVHLSRLWSKLGEDVTLQPSVTVFNLTNSSNYDFANNPLIGVLNGSTGSVNGTTYTQRTNKVTVGSGVFGLGGPRVVEFGARFTF